MQIISNLFYVIVFPGFIFLILAGLFLEWIDRVLIAKFQNRVGPPWFQPAADFIKLFAKEDVTPEKADKFMFAAAPIFALAAVFTSIAFLPVLREPLISFKGDVVVLAYLLTIPTFAIFIGGWYSVNYFASVGAMRTMLLWFSYEIPLLLALLSPAIISGSWQISKILAFQDQHGWAVLYIPLGLVIALIALVGKLERVPFDIPEAETEIVEGPLCEYSGRKLAMFRLMFDVELVIGAAIISTFYLGGFSAPNIFLSVLVFIIKTFFVLFIVSMVKAVFGRVRIDQMLGFCWKFLIPLTLVQLLFVVIGLIRF
jgi:NADH-quinone oxidoreductase subunit H